MMKKSILALAILSATAAPAFAENSGGFYGEIGSGVVAFSNSTIPGTNAAAFGNAAALDVAAGYRFNSMLAAEVGYAMSGDAINSYTNATTTLKASVAQVAVVGTYSLNDSFDLFGKLGGAFTSITLSGTGAAATWGSSNSSSNLLWGLGAQYNINKHFGIRAQYENLGNTNVVVNTTTPATMSVGVGMTSVGIVYSF
jgi:OOP family OmpA-OmpF porin